MSRPWILLCPSSRGIGFALARHLLRTTRAPILATARSPDTCGVRDRILDGLSGVDKDRLEVVRVDVTAEETVAAAARRAADLFPPATHHLRLALALPGVLLRAEKSAAQVDYDAALETLRVNVLGPLLLIKHFEPFLPRKSTELSPAGGGDEGSGLPPHAVWVNMAARVGSVSDNRLGGWYSYRASKAAVNSLTKSLDPQLLARSGPKAMAMSYHPGTVKTDLSRDFWDSVANDTLLEPDVAADKMARVVRDMTVEQRGRCWDYNGQEVPP